MAHKYLLLVSVFITVSPTVPETPDLQDAEHGALEPVVACGRQENGHCQCLEFLLVLSKN